jgi:HAD superfamily hydrolase (TIGR01549 family)
MWQMSYADERVEAVLFDFGGTLFEYACLRPAVHDALVRLCAVAQLKVGDHQLPAAYVAALRRAFAHYLPQPFYLMRDLFRDAAVDTLEWLAALSLVARGNNTAVEDWDLLLNLEEGAFQNAHMAAATCDPFLEVAARDFRLREGVVDTLDALRARGVRVGLVTNMDIDELEHLVRISALESHLDFVLSSEEARSCKPDPGIFAEAVRRAGSRAAATLFVGDSIAQDVEGARRAGLRSVLTWAPRDAEPPRGRAAAHFVIRRIPELIALIDRPPSAQGGSRC